MPMMNGWSNRTAIHRMLFVFLLMGHIPVISSLACDMMMGPELITARG